MPIIARRLSASAGVWYSRQRALLGQSASLRQSCEQNGLPAKPAASMHSESSAQRIPGAGSGEQAAPNALAAFATTQVSWKPSFEQLRAHLATRPPHSESAPDCGNWLDGRPTLRWPQKFSGHSPPPAASGGQMASGRSACRPLIDAAVLLVACRLARRCDTPPARPAAATTHRKQSSSSNHYAITCGNPKGFHAPPRCHYNLSLLGLRHKTPQTRQPPSSSSGTRSCPARSRTRTPDFLIRELRALGVTLRRIEIIPDVTDEIAASVARCRPASTTSSRRAASGRRTTT